LHVPGLSKYLLSVQKLAHDNHAFVELHPSFFCLKDQATRRVLLHGRSRNGLYLVPCSTPSSSASSRPTVYSSVTVSGDLWHSKLRHPSSSVVESIIRSNKLACVPSRVSAVCDSCQRAKVHQLPFSHSTHVISSPLELVHSDVWGLAITFVGGFKFYVSFLDDISRFT
jgi:hypothetical protein